MTCSPRFDCQSVATRLPLDCQCAGQDMRDYAQICRFVWGVGEKETAPELGRRCCESWWRRGESNHAPRRCHLGLSGGIGTELPLEIRKAPHLLVGSGALISYLPPFAASSTSLRFTLLTMVKVPSPFAMRCQRWLTPPWRFQRQSSEPSSALLPTTSRT